MRSRRTALLLVDPDGLFEDVTGAGEAIEVDGPSDSAATGAAGVVLCSKHRTRFELEQMQRRMSISEPFIVENGGAVFVPEGYFGHVVPGARTAVGYEVVELGGPYREVVARLHEVAALMHIEVTGFSDLSIEDVAARCGVSLLSARLAKLRGYVEPYWVTSGEVDVSRRLKRALRAGGLVCDQWRGHDLVGSSTHLVAAVSVLLKLYRRSGDPIAFTCGWSAPAEWIGPWRARRLCARAWPADIHRLRTLLVTEVTCLKQNRPDDPHPR